MAVKIGHASIDERGKINGGAAGDSTGGEVFIREWYNGKWNVVLRPKKAIIAEKSAKACEAACSNNKIGYDQYQRNTLYTQAKAVNWDISKIKTACECDCSSLMHICAMIGGAKLSYGSNGLCTFNMVKAFVDSGDYEKLTANKYLTSDKFLKRGDILVRESGHTAMVLGNGSNAASESNSSGVSTSATTKKSVAEIAKEVISGKWGNGEERKRRLIQSGYDWEAVQNAVNSLLSGKPAKTVDEIAREVISGKWGNGAERTDSLQRAGYNPVAVQEKVNKLLR